MMGTVNPHTGQEPRFFAASARATLVAILLIFLVGLGVRFIQLSDPPLEFHAARQLHSMFIARGMFYQIMPDAPAWQRDMAVSQQQQEGLIEPQINERLTSWLYRLAGEADLRIPRLLAIFFWSLGGLGLFFLTRDLTDANGGVIALTFYLTVSYSVMASRSFMPEPLLIAAIIWAWWGMVRWSRNPDWKRAVIAGLLAGFAIFVKSTAVFFIGGAWIGLLLCGIGLRAAVKNRQVWLMALLTVLPYALYHVYAVYITGLMSSQFGLRFFPAMWRDLKNYYAWQDMIDYVVGFEWLLVALAGYFLLRDRFARGLLLGSLAGYGLYGMTFIYYTTTHDYYHLPLVPMVAVGLGSAAALLFSRLTVKRPWAGWVFAILLLIPVVMNLMKANVKLKERDFQADVALAQEAGALFQPSDKVVSMAPYYSSTLRYWGWVNSTNWPSNADFNLRSLAGTEYDIKALFDETTSGMDYFLVMNFDEFAAQPELKAILQDSFTVVKQTSDYILFDLHQPLTP
jgi:hypothetical protein